MEDDWCANLDCGTGPNVIPIEGQPTSPQVDELANTGMDPWLGMFAVVLVIAGIVAIVKGRVA